jgi:hypothetical protein
MRSAAAAATWCKYLRKLEVVRIAEVSFVADLVTTNHFAA